MCRIKFIFLHRQFWSELQVLPFPIVLVCIILTRIYAHFQESVADFLSWVLANLQTPPSQSSKQDLRQVCITALFDCTEVCWENRCGGCDVVVKMSLAWFPGVLVLRGGIRQMQDTHLSALSELWKQVTVSKFYFSFFQGIPSVATGKSCGYEKELSQENKL